jgi:hypothetical protein
MAAKERRGRSEHQAEGARVLAGRRSGDGPLSVRVRPSSLKRDCDLQGNQYRWKGTGQRTSLKERAGVKRGSACSFAPAGRFARHGELTPCVPFPRCCLFVRPGGPGQGPGFSPAGLAGAAGVLDAGDRAPIIRAAGKGHAAAGCACLVVAAPWPACGRAGPRACIHPFACPRHACRGAWGGYAAGRAGSITRAPALPGRRWPVPGGGSTLHGLAPGRGPGPGHAACPGRMARRMWPSRMP